MDFGMEGLGIVPVKIVNGHTPRTAQLLGEAYRRHDPSAAQRAQYVAELGLVALPEGAAYVIDGMKDGSPLVRAEAARSGISAVTWCWYPAWRFGPSPFASTPPWISTRSLVSIV
jgi:hypothetical protein